MTSSNRNIFRVTGPLWGEFTGHWWIPHTKASDAERWCFFYLRPNKRLRRHRAHYDVSIILQPWKQTVRQRAPSLHPLFFCFVFVICEFFFWKPDHYIYFTAFIVPVIIKRKISIRSNIFFMNYCYESLSSTSQDISYLRYLRFE